jgi:DNA-directed RNA polymerase subunit RPC12/RpoP
MTVAATAEFTSRVCGECGEVFESNNSSKECFNCALERVTGGIYTSSRDAFTEDCIEARQRSGTPLSEEEEQYRVQKAREVWYPCSRCPNSFVSSAMQKPGGPQCLCPECDALDDEEANHQELLSMQRDRRNYC